MCDRARWYDAAGRVQELALAVPLIVREVTEVPALRIQAGETSLLLNPKQLLRDESTVGSNITILCEAFEQIKVNRPSPSTPPMAAGAGGTALWPEWRADIGSSSLVAPPPAVRHCCSREQSP